MSKSPKAKSGAPSNVARDGDPVEQAMAEAAALSDEELDRRLRDEGLDPDELDDDTREILGLATRERELTEDAVRSMLEQAAKGKIGQA